MGTDDLTIFERLEIQMAYVVPLLRDLQDVLGEDVLNDALDERHRRTMAAAEAEAAERYRDAPPPPIGARADSIDRAWAHFAAGDALEFELVARSEHELGYDVHACAYAELMQRLDATDIGQRLICNADFIDAAKLGWDLERTMTNMAGDGVCDFRFRTAGVEPS